MLLIQRRCQFESAQLRNADQERIHCRRRQNLRPSANPRRHQKRENLGKKILNFPFFPLFFKFNWIGSSQYLFPLFFRFHFKSFTFYRLIFYICPLNDWSFGKNKRFGCFAFPRKSRIFFHWKLTFWSIDGVDFRISADYFVK